jgi:regulator-associated protein of mTOR
MALGDLMASRYSHSSPLVSSALDHCSSHETEDLIVQTRDADSGPPVNDFENTVTSMAYLPQTIVLREFRHDAFEVSVHSNQSVLVSKWRPMNRTKTWCVAIVLCLNIKADPPDVIKISPCARIQCWIDPFSMPPRRAIETIGETLSLQYERWQPKAKFKIELDPTVEEVKKLCTTCRKFAKTDRVLFHYNGHGVLKPTKTGQIWLLDKNLTQYIPLHITDLDSWLLTPSIYVFDCSAAGMIVDAFLQIEELRPSSSSEYSSRDCILLAACEAHETLPLNDEFPADVFTSCLTTPIRMALQWSRSRSLLHGSLADSFIDRIPGIQTDRRTPRGELNWIFTAVTDTIAWNVFPNDLFQRLFRQDLLVASLFRNFLLAERILRSANCSPISYPRLPPTHQHHMWDAWDMAAEICLAQLPTLLTDPSAEFQASTFFAEQLTAFEIWLDSGSERKKAPEQLPIVLQVLQGQRQRFRALVLLGRFLDMGPWAVQLALSVGIFPYVLKLLRSTNPEIRQILVFIWTKILAVDKSCQVDLVKDKGQIYFLRFLDSLEAYPEQRAMSAFILAVIVDGHKSGQAACLEAGIINICLKHLQGVSTTNDSPTEPLFPQCLSLCLGKLWEDFTQAQLIGLHADALPIFGYLLTQPQPEVRASAIFALGTLLDVGDEVNRDDDEDDDEKVRTESSIIIIKSLLSVVSDGSPLVRAELAVALARFAFGHNKYLKSIAAAYWKPQSKSTLDSLPSFTIRTSDTIAKRVSSTESFIFGDESSRRFDSRISDDSANTRLKPLDNSLYSQCVSAMYILAKDPSPRVAALGRRVLSIIGIEQTLPKSVNASSAHTPAKFRTPPVSPPRSTHLRRVCSLDFNSSVMTSKNSDSFLNSSQDQSLLPQSLVYNWTYAHFSKSLLTPTHDNEDIIARREDREKLSLDQIAKCRYSSVRKLHSQIPSWDTQFEMAARKALFQPFYPIVVAADEHEQIRVWNYEKGSLLNCFNNHNHPDRGISKLCLVNELDDNDLLLVASSDGNVRVWKDYSVKGKQKLATAFSSVQGHKPGVRSLNAVVDWQQTSGYMYASGEISSIMVWDLNNEQLVGSIPLASDSSISALSASQIQGGQFAAGFADGSVKLFDTRTPDSHVYSTTQSYTQRVGKIVGIGFQPGLDPSKIVSASEFGGIKLFDVRHQKDAYFTLNENKGPFTTLAVHRHTPIFASGSARQTIDVFNIDGERLGSSNIRSNINCLTFHPYQVLLAAAVPDSLNFYLS